MFGTSPAPLIGLRTTGSSLVLPPTTQLLGVGIFLQLLDLLPPAHPVGFWLMGEERETGLWSSFRFAGEGGRVCHAHSAHF